MSMESYGTISIGLAEQGRWRAVALQLLARRAARDTFLPRSLFAEAGWDALLTLFANEAHPLTTADLATSADVPVAHMNRWLDHLVEEGLAEVAAGSAEGGTRSMRITEAGRSALQDYLQQNFRTRLVYRETNGSPV